MLFRFVYKPKVQGIAFWHQPMAVQINALDDDPSAWHLGTIYLVHAGDNTTTCVELPERDIAEAHLHESMIDYVIAHHKSDIDVIWAHGLARIGASMEKNA